MRWKKGANSGRGTAEQWIKEGKYALNWTRLSCQQFVANQVRLLLFILAYNLGNLLTKITHMNSQSDNSFPYHWERIQLPDNRLSVLGRDQLIQKVFDPLSVLRVVSNLGHQLRRG